MVKSELTIDKLIEEARNLCTEQSKIKNPTLYGVTDGKSIGTHIEHEFKKYIASKYDTTIGSSAKGLDLPHPDILTDIKVTSSKHPQSSCPYRNYAQKIYGLGYNLLVLVYSKTDDHSTKTSTLTFDDFRFIPMEHTADSRLTSYILKMLNSGTTSEKIAEFLMYENEEYDETTSALLAEKIMTTPPSEGWITISDARQWRLTFKKQKANFQVTS